MSVKTTAAPTARTQRKAATRAALKAAARACFAEQGFRATQVGDIARRANVAHGTFYVHFESQEALVDELVAEFNGALLDRLARAWRQLDADEPRVIARRLAELCLDHWRRERELLVALVERLGAGGSLPALRDGISPSLAPFVADKLRALAAASGQTLPEAELVAHALLGLWTRVALQHLFASPRASRRATVELLASLSIGALAALLPALRPHAFPSKGA
jgi:AcrR family transcriptional regulator